MRKERGIARSLMAHINMCVDSGIREAKSQKVSWAVATLDTRCETIHVFKKKTSDCAALYMVGTKLVDPGEEQLQDGRAICFAIADGEIDVRSQPFERTGGHGVGKESLRVSR